MCLVSRNRIEQADVQQRLPAISTVASPHAAPEAHTNACLSCPHSTVISLIMSPLMLMHCSAHHILLFFAQGAQEEGAMAVDEPAAAEAGPSARKSKRQATSAALATVGLPSAAEQRAAATTVAGDLTDAQV